MTSKFEPSDDLKKYIDAFWFYKNQTGKTEYFLVIPDGCSDIIFQFDNPNNINNNFISGVMEHAQLTPLPSKINLFGIRFKPAMLFHLLNVDMSKLANKKVGLPTINNKLSKSLKINQTASHKNIVLNIENKLRGLLKNNSSNDNFFKIIDEITISPQVTITEMSLKYGFTIKSLERLFYKRIGLPPKKFARIMRFQKAHNKISKDGFGNLITIALSSGYFDQAHFNREYKSLTGNSPSSETMSILYNT